MKVDLKDWMFDEKHANEQRLITVTLHLQYPDITSLLDLKPKQRIKAIDQDQLNKLRTLIAFGDFSDHEVIGTLKRPTGIKVTLMLSKLQGMDGDQLISGITVHNIENAKMRAQKRKSDKQFFCVKMTVLIEVENVKSKNQDIEKRFVLIKAASCEDAIEKLKLQKDKYATPYLNPAGRLVRWRIISFDDCYETDIASPKDIESVEGVEIYSKLKSKKRREVWDGKL
jgi:hypothetical protein